MKCTTRSLATAVSLSTRYSDPRGYIESKGVTLQEADRVELTGSIVDSYWSQYDDQRFLIATQITVDGKTVQLRDEWGYPLWHGTGWFYYSPE